MDGDMEISLDKLPIKRLDVIEENGAERFPSDVDYDEKRVSLIRRIDFAWAVEEDDAKKKNKKQKNSSKESTGPWQWQGMVENLQLAHQELSLIINLIDTVEANDSVTVAGMTRPKPLPNELLSDLAVSTATKLQNYRNLGKYFKQSAKALEQQINREARFYGALIRLQRNWKVKRQRVAASTHVNDGFTFDLFDSSLYDSTFVIRPSSLSTIRVDHDSAGMLSINLPQESCHSLCFGFLGLHSTDDLKESNNKEDLSLVDDIPGKLDKHPASDGESVKETHLLLREVHKSIFAEQLFDMVNREAFNQSAGVYLTGIRENYLEISIGQGASLFISLVSSSKVNAPKNLASSDTSNAIAPAEEKLERPSKKPGFPSCNSCEIYLQRIFHEHVFRNRKDQFKLNSTRVPSKPEKDDSGILGHFCMSLAHRIYSKRVLLELENVVSRVPYLHLMSHPTWNSRKSSSTVFVNVPPIAHQGYSDSQTDADGKKNVVKSQFRTIVSVNDDCITVEGECSPNVVGLFKGSSHDLYSMNSYNCDLADLPVVILQQVASQTICWLHEEARTVGAKVNQDFLSLSFEIEQGETVSLVAHVDPEDVHGGISWWLVVGDNNAVEGRKYQAGLSQSVSDNKKFLGHLSLELLYAAVMDLVSFCGGPTEQER